MKIRLIIIAMIFSSIFAAAETKKSPGFFALYGWGETLIEHLSDIDKAGIKWLRVGGPMPSKEADKCILEAAKRGIHCVPFVGDYRQRELAQKNDMKTWRELVKNTVLRYGTNGTLWQENSSVRPVPVEYIEIWNEPNIDHLEAPPGKLRDECYYELLKLAYEEIKALNKDIQVIGFNTAGGIWKSNTGPKPDGMFEKIKHFGWFKFIKDINKIGGSKYYDIAGIHPYTTPRAPEKVGLFEALEKLRAELKQNGNNQPVWYTEVGYPLDYPNNGNVRDEDQQADYLLRLFALASSRGIVQVQVMYVTDIIFSNDNSKRTFGFFTPDKRWRKQATATKVMIDLLGDPPEFVNAAADGVQGFYEYVFKGKNGKNVLMAWTINDEAEEKEIKVGSTSAPVIDKMGVKRILTAEDGKIKLKVSGSPQFIIE